MLSLFMKLRTLYFSLLLSGIISVTNAAPKKLQKPPKSQAKPQATKPSSLSKTAPAAATAAPDIAKATSTPTPTSTTKVEPTQIEHTKIEPTKIEPPKTKIEQPLKETKEVIKNKANNYSKKKLYTNYSKKKLYALIAGCLALVLIVAYILYRSQQEKALEAAEASRSNVYNFREDLLRLQQKKAKEKAEAQLKKAAEDKAKAEAEAARVAAEDKAKAARIAAAEEQIKIANKTIIDHYDSLQKKVDKLSAVGDIRRKSPNLPGSEYLRLKVLPNTAPNPKWQVTSQKNLKREQALESEKLLLELEDLKLEDSKREQALESEKLLLTNLEGSLIIAEQDYNKLYYEIINNLDVIPHDWYRTREKDNAKRLKNCLKMTKEFVKKVQMEINLAEE